MIELDSFILAVEQLQLEGFEEITFFDRTYFVCADIKSEGIPGEWHVSSAGYAADVYVWGALPEVYRRALVIHELIEAHLTIYEGLCASDAHKIAVIHDARYAEKRLSKKKV